MPGVDESLVSGAIQTAIETMVPWTVRLGGPQFHPGADYDSSPPQQEWDTNRNDLVEGYAILSRIEHPRPNKGHGYIGQDDSIRTVRYRITGMGIQYNQAEMLANQSVKAITDRQPTGGFITPVVVPGHTVIDRRRGSSAFHVPPGDPMGAHQSITYFEVTVAATA